MSFLKEQMGVLLSIAREDLEKDSNVQPFAVAFLPDVMKIRLPRWKTLKQRRHVQREVRRWMEQSHADCGIVMAEAWNKAIEAACEIGDAPDDLRHVTVKDIRHVWITNAMRSGMDPFI